MSTAETSIYLLMAAFTGMGVGTAAMKSTVFASKYKKTTALFVTISVILIVVLLVYVYKNPSFLVMKTNKPKSI